MDADHSLEAVRRKIDAIDDAIHNLIIERTEVLQQIPCLRDGTGGRRIQPGELGRV